MGQRMEKTSVRNIILIVLMSSSVLFALVLGLIFYQNTYTTVKQSKERELTLLSRETADKIDRFFFERRGDLTVLAEAVRLLLQTEDQGFVQSYLDQIVKAYKVYNAVALLNARGEILVSAGNTAGLDYGRRVPAMLEGPYVSEMLEGPAGTSMLILAMPIIASDGEVLGAVAAQLGLDTVDGILAEVRFGETGRAVLRRADEPMEAPDIRYGKALNAGRVSATTALDMMGPDDPWAVTVEQAVTEAFSVAYHSIEIFFVFVFMIALIGFFLIAMILTRRIAHPFNALIEKVEDRYGGGALGGFDRRNLDEISVLASSFDLLLGELDGRARQLLVKSGEAVSAERMHGLMELLKLDIPNGILVTDERGVLVSMNQEAADILGTGAEKWVGKPLAALIPDILPPSFINPEGHGSLDERCTIIPPEGPAVPAVFSRFDHRDAEDRYLGATLVINREEERARFESHVARTRRYSEMGELSAGIAHEIRNPLASIRGYAQMALREAAIPDTVHHDLQVILQESERIGTLLNRFLVFARPDKPHLIRHHLGDVLEELERAVAPELESKGIALRWSLSHPEPQRFDRDQLRQVLLNVLLNAIQASPVGGTVHISTTVDHARHTLVIGILDQGGGIPEQDQAQIFEPFFTTREGGSGLGLPISARIMDNHGGKLTLINEGEGARAEIRLPFGKEDNDE